MLITNSDSVYYVEEAKCKELDQHADQVEFQESKVERKRDTVLICELFVHVVGPKVKFLTVKLGRATGTMIFGATIEEIVIRLPVMTLPMQFGLQHIRWVAKVILLGHLQCTMPFDWIDKLDSLTYLIE